MIRRLCNTTGNYSDSLMATHAWYTGVFDEPGDPGYKAASHSPSKPGSRLGNPPLYSLEGSHLCHASGQGDLGLVKSLVEVLGVPVDARDRCGRTALHCASSHDHKDVLLYLLAQDADVEVKEGSHQMTALHIAAINNNEEVAKCLLEHGADVNATAWHNFKPMGPSTPLHWVSSSRGNANMCELLIKHGAEVNKVNGNHETPLMSMMAEPRSDVLAVLLAHGADPNIPKADGVTPLMAMSQSGRLDIVKILVANGAAVNRTSPILEPPLFFASCEGHAEIAETLLISGARVDEKRHDDEMTSLILASQEGHMATVRVLLRYGAGVNALSVKRLTPLHMACLNGHTDIVKLLLSKGVDDINAVSTDGYTPLHEACMQGRKEVVHVLLRHKEVMQSFQLRCDDGLTPIQWAMQGGFLDVVNVLLKAASTS